MPLACSGDLGEGHSGPGDLDGDNIFIGEPLHPLQHAVQLFTDNSNEGWGAHLGDFTARGVWSTPESLLHINFLELKAVFLALKSFGHLCRDQIVAMDNTIVVSYVNKEAGMRSGSLCALLWRRLAWCHPRPLECNSGQVIQTRPGDPNRMVPISAGVQSLVLKMGPTACGPICNPVQSQTPQNCVTGTGPDSLGGRRLESDMGKSGCLCLSSVSLLNQVITKIVDQGCRRMILIAPGWPNMPWFWDLVELSVQIPFRLPLQKDLVTQPFNRLPHRNLSNLNLHAWLLEPLPFKNKGSLMK